MIAWIFSSALLALAPAASPSPTPSPAPPCKVPNADARAITMPAPDYPDSALRAHWPDSSVLVEVFLSPQGTITSTTLLRSSGNADIDNSTLIAVKKAKYSPKIVDCKPTDGIFLFHADFTGQH